MPVPLNSPRRNLVAVLVAAGGLLCTGLMYKVAADWEEAQLHRQLENVAEAETNALQGRLQALTDELRVLRSMFELPREISPTEFRGITVPTLQQYPMLYGIGWAPRQGEGETAHYRMTRLNLRDVGPTTLDFDLAAEPRRREALLRACDTASAAATRPVKLQPGNVPGTTLMLPIFTAGKPLRDIPERRANLLGVVAAAVDTEVLIEEVVGRLFWEQLDFVVREEGPDGEIIHVHAPRPANQPTPTAAELESRPLYDRAVIRAADRAWTITYVPSPNFLSQHGSRQALAAMLLGLLLTAIATSNAVLLQRRQASIERLVHEQTAALRLSQERLDHVLQATADGIWEQDMVSGRLTFVSPRTEELLGYPPGSLVHPNFDVRSVFADSADRYLARQALEDHIQHGKPYVAEVRFRRANGDVRWVRLRGVVARNADSLPLRLVGALRDISAEHEAAAQRAHMLARFEALIQDTPLVMALGFDREHNVSLWNHAAEHFFGYTPRQARGRRVRDLFLAAAEGEWFVDMLEDVWRTGLPYGPRETGITVAEGQRRLLLAVFPLLEGTQVVEVFAMGVDITDRVRAERELRLSETRFRDLSQLSADWFWEQDAELRFSYFSSGLERSGIGMNEHLGKLRWELPIQLSAQTWAAHRADLEARRPFRDFEYRIVNADGAVRWFVTNGIPLYDDEGGFVGYRGNGRDITARKQLEEELHQHRDHLEELVQAQTADLRRAKEAAEQANRAKSDFLANMSHELRTPMHAVLSFARIGLLKADTVGPEKLKEYFEHIRAGGQRLLDLVNDLLDLSKLEAGRMEYAMGQTDLRRCVEQVLDELAPLLDGKKLTRSLDVSARDSHVWGDARRLEQVIRNLVGNAIKFTPEGRCVTVEVADDAVPVGRRASDVGQTKPALRLTVADEGIGIPEEELEAVFGKFTQSSITFTGAGGTGLGLAICREIVQAHRGIIRARSRPTGGVALDVLLPLDTAPEATRKETA